MTDDRKPEEIDDADLDQAEGGAGYLKIGDIKGESVNSSNVTLKRGTIPPAADTASSAHTPREHVSFTYQKILHD